PGSAPGRAAATEALLRPCRARPARVTRPPLRLPSLDPVLRGEEQDALLDAPTRERGPCGRIEIHLPSVAVQAVGELWVRAEVRLVVDHDPSLGLFEHEVDHPFEDARDAGGGGRHRKGGGWRVAPLRLPTTPRRRLVVPRLGEEVELP